MVRVADQVENIKIILSYKRDVLLRFQALYNSKDNTAFFNDLMRPLGKVKYIDNYNWPFIIGI